MSAVGFNPFNDDVHPVFVALRAVSWNIGFIQNADGSSIGCVVHNDAAGHIRAGSKAIKVADVRFCFRIGVVLVIVGREEAGAFESDACSAQK